MKYRSNMKQKSLLSHIINSFTLIAIFISCLGLFGLAAFSAEQRNKEIGIRKVLGASVTGYCAIIIKRVFKVGVYCYYNCHTHCLVGNE